MNTAAWPVRMPVMLSAYVGSVPSHGSAGPDDFTDPGGETLESISINDLETISIGDLENLPRT
jgi:hypothetical protein